MRCLVFCSAWISIVFFSSALLAQGESPEARQLQSQLEELQHRLDQLRAREGANRNVTEIGSSRGRTRNDGEPRLIVRIYDLADLFSIAPSYPAREATELQDTGKLVFPETAGADGAGAAAVGGIGGGIGGGMGGMGGMGGGMFSVPSQPATIPAADPFRDTLAQASGAGTVSGAARTSVENLIETITSTISPDEWDGVGGPSSIKMLGASLVVSAPTHVHDKVSALIDLLRKRWRSLRTISLDAHWLWLTEGDLKSASLQAEDQPAYGVLTDAAWKSLRDAAAAHADHVGFHAALTCYNGQTVHTVAGSQQLVVSGLIPVVGGKDVPAAYRPVTTTIQDGAALQITPVATRTAKYVAADIHSRVTLLAGRADSIVGREGRALAASDARQLVDVLDRPVVQSQRLSTTLRIPVGRPMLIGGMTFSASDTRDPNLYLFVIARVQELLDDENIADAPVGTAPKPDLGTIRKIPRVAARSGERRRSRASSLAGAKN